MTTATATDLYWAWRHSHEHTMPCLNPTDGRVEHDDAGAWRTIVECRSMIDLDGGHAVLLAVKTKVRNPDGGRGVEIVDHVAAICLPGTGRVDVEWHQQPRLFFDGDLAWMNEALVWFSNLVVGAIEADAGSGHQLDAEQLASIDTYNRAVREADRRTAAALGLHFTLPDD